MGSPTCIGEQASGNIEVDCREPGPLRPVAVCVRLHAVSNRTILLAGGYPMPTLVQVEQSNQFIHAYKASPNMTLGKEVPSRMWLVPLSKWSRFCALGTLESSIAAVSRFGAPCCCCCCEKPAATFPSSCPPSVLRLSRDRECCVFHNLLSLPPKPDTNLTATALRALQQRPSYHITSQHKAQHSTSKPASRTTNY
jgi:hypothetical protein